MYMFVRGMQWNLSSVLTLHMYIVQPPTYSTQSLLPNSTNTRYTSQLSVRMVPQVTGLEDVL